MKKTLFGLLIFVTLGNITNAQIKVVGEDYSTKMTGSKEYYDRDVNFEHIFPIGQQIGVLYPTLSYYRDENFINMIGDTVYVDTRVLNIIPGYYVIDGCVFCDDIADSIASSLGYSFYHCGGNTNSLKKEILKNRHNFSTKDLYKYFVCYVLRSTTDNKVVYFDNKKLFAKIKLLKFYSEASKYKGKEIFWTSGYSCDYSQQRFNTAPFSQRDDWRNVVYDALTDNMIRLEDPKYEVSDIILKDGYFYAILSGAKTGTFSMEIDRIVYVNSTEDMRECLLDGSYGNIKGDKAILVFNCPQAHKNGRDAYCHNAVYIITDNQKRTLENRRNVSRTQQEQDRKRKELEQEKEKKQQDALFLNKMIAKYKEPYGTIIGKRQIAIGMTMEMCRDAWGRPMNTYRTTTKYGQSEVWCYNYKTRVYFNDGKVVQIDD